MAIDFLTTFKGSYAGPFYPAGWDYKKIQRITGLGPEKFGERQPHWHKDFQPFICDDDTGGVETMNARVGYEIFDQIRRAAEEERPLAMILPVGPMGMYKWAVYFCQRHNLSCRHVWGFNMDEWSDARGRTLPASTPGSFQGAMEDAFYGPLGELTVPKKQRFFATHQLLPTYPERIARLREQGGSLVVVYGVGRGCHIAFWEPHFAAEFKSVAEWRKQPYRLGAALHPLTIEQNSLHTFASRLTLVPLFANTIGPGLFANADYCIGGADGASGPLNWQGQSIWMTLRYGSDPWVPSSFMPTQPGRLFVIRKTAGPLAPDAH